MAERRNRLDDDLFAPRKHIDRDEMIESPIDVDPTGLAAGRRQHLPLAERPGATITAMDDWEAVGATANEPTPQKDSGDAHLDYVRAPQTGVDASDADPDGYYRAEWNDVVEQVEVGIEEIEFAVADVEEMPLRVDGSEADADGYAIELGGAEAGW